MQNRVSWCRKQTECYILRIYTLIRRILLFAPDENFDSLRNFKENIYLPIDEKKRRMGKGINSRITVNKKWREKQTERNKTGIQMTSSKQISRIHIFRRIHGASRPRPFLPLYRCSPIFFFPRFCFSFDSSRTTILPARRGLALR